jgi:hypothetical protein
MNLNTQEIIAGIALYAESKKESEALERFQPSSLFLKKYIHLYRIQPISLTAHIIGNQGIGTGNTP